jgi:hypothetical protein
MAMEKGFRENDETVENRLYTDRNRQHNRIGSIGGLGKIYLNERLNTVDSGSSNRLYLRMSSSIDNTKTNKNTEGFMANHSVSVFTKNMVSLFGLYD